jgi:hypothetical protein
MHGILAHICVILRVYNTWKICSKLTVFHSCIYPSSSRSACHWHLAHDGKTVRPSCPLVVLVGFVVFVFSFWVCSYLSDSIILVYIYVYIWIIMNVYMHIYIYMCVGTLLHIPYMVGDWYPAAQNWHEATSTLPWEVTPKRISIQMGDSLRFSQINP